MELDHMASVELWESLQYLHLVQNLFQWVDATRSIIQKQLFHSILVAVLSSLSAPAEVAIFVSQDNSPNLMIAMREKIVTNLYTLPKAPFPKSFVLAQT